MTRDAPDFRLRRINADGSFGPPVIAALGDLSGTVVADRRGFLRSAGLFGGVIGATALPGDGTAAELDDVCVPGARAHETRITRIAVSPDGELLATASLDPVVKLWSIGTGEVLHRLEEAANGVRDLAFTPDAAGLLYTTGLGHVVLADVSDGAVRAMRVLGEPAGSAIAITPDGRHALAGDFDGRIEVLRLPDLDRVAQISAHPDQRIWRLAVAPDIPLAAAASVDGTISLWALPSLDPVGRLEGHADELRSIAFHPFWPVLHSASKDGVLRSWSVDTFEEVGAPVRLNAPLAAVAFSPDGAILASGGADRTLALQPYPALAAPTQRGGLDGAITDVAFSADGDLLLGGTAGGAVVIWVAPDFEPAGCLLDPELQKETTETIVMRREVSEGRWISFTQPCGSPIPAGAICTCNCVPGSIAVTRPRSNRVCNCNTVDVCTCNTVQTGRTICTCNLVCVCMAV